MKNVTLETLEEAVQARRDGAKHKEILEKFGLSHSQFEFAWLRLETMKDLVGSEPATAASVSALRADGKSWGVISILVNQTEGATRKLFSEATGVKHQGQRIGKGGRWLYTEQGLYNEGLKQTGTSIPVGQEFKGREGALVAAEAQRNLVTAEISEVIAEFKKVTGRTTVKGLTKAQMIGAILKGEKAQPVKKAAKAAKASA